MSQIPIIQTKRLILRQWRAEDRIPFAALNADLRVVEFLPKALTREESDAVIAQIEAHFKQHGFGLWAVEVSGVAPFIGFVGLAVPNFEAPFTPCMEIGWRLACEYWGFGYATEAARGVLQFAFKTLQLNEVLSFTVPANLLSRKVMERLGMVRSPADDFEHPKLPAGHSLRLHVLYRLSRAKWLEQHSVGH